MDKSVKEMQCDLCGIVGLLMCRHVPRIPSPASFCRKAINTSLHGGSQELLKDERNQRVATHNHLTISSLCSQITIDTCHQLCLNLSGSQRQHLDHSTKREIRTNKKKHIAILWLSRITNKKTQEFSLPIFRMNNPDPLMQSVLPE